MSSNRLNLLNYDLVVFDLGGVIVPWVGTEALATWTKAPKQDVQDRLQTLPFYKKFETGQIDGQTFARHMIEAFDYDMNEAEFLELWNSWVHSPYPDVITKIKALKDNILTACLSNTNAVHWEHLSRMFDPHEVFNFVFASQHVGLVKPDPEIFKYVIEKTHMTPSRILYFDDTQMHIDAAQKLGIHAHKVDPIMGVVPYLRDMELIS